MRFLHPEYLYLLLLLIPLIVWYVVRLSKTQASFNLASTNAFKGMKPDFRVYMRHFPFLLRIISIALIIIVIARPQSVSSWEETETQGIDIVLALDVSGSMLSQDLQPDRLQAAKRVAAESFTQCPLTNDHAVLLNLLNEIQYGMIEDGTAIGMGLATSVNRLRESQSESRVVILLTDGTNNSGQIAPLTAADLARSYGIRVYTVGVGTTGMAPTPVQTPFGVRMQNLPVDIDERTLTEIAAMTGGQYFRAEDTEGLRQVYEEIDEMEKYLISVQNVTQRKELFLHFAIAALILMLFELLLRRTWLRSIP